MTETLKKMTDCEFKVFTSRTYYLCLQLPLHLCKVAKIPKPPKGTCSKKELGLLRKYQGEFGQSVKQLTVRDFTTKDKPGTLPVSAYKLLASEVNPLNSEVITPALSRKVALSSGSYGVLSSSDTRIIVQLDENFWDHPGALVSVSQFVPNPLDCFQFEKSNFVMISGKDLIALDDCDLVKTADYTEVQEHVLLGMFFFTHCEQSLLKMNLLRSKKRLL